MTRPVSGHCLCGAVRVHVADLPSAMEACHCANCRRSTGGGPLLGVAVPKADVTWEGEDHIRVHRSADWAERGFCASCGSTLFFRMAGEAATANISLAPGVLDDMNGLELVSEMFIDQKPDGYDLAGDRPRHTRAQAMQMLQDFLAKKAQEAKS